jgi:hypothetical protein
MSLCSQKGFVGLMTSLYIFLDEGGNFDFSANGTKYFTLTALSVIRPFSWEHDLVQTKYDLIEEGVDVELFHASEDKQATRDRVFAALTPYLLGIRIDALIVEKRKTRIPLQAEELFYPRMLAYLLQYIFKQVATQNYDSITVMTDTIPIHKKREAVEKAVKETFARMLSDTIPYQVLHHASKSCVSLQVVDYCNWAIYRKWANNDTRSYTLIASAIESEFDIFQARTRYYY